MLLTIGATVKMMHVIVKKSMCCEVLPVTKYQKMATCGEITGMWHLKG
jgi:hypothetical protein